MSNWPSSVGKIIDGVTTFSSDSAGAIIETLTQRTEWLKEAVDEYDESYEGSKGYTLYDTGFSPECTKGMLVAWDTGLGVYIPALAKGTGTYREDGTEIPADSANVVGVVIEINPNTTGGTILCCGHVNDPDIVAKLVGESGGTGNYYLSMDTPGTAYRAAASENPMSAYCFTYLYSTNDKKPAVFIRPYPPAYNGTSEIRSVEVTDGGDLLTAETVNGAVKLKLATQLVEGDEGQGRAIVGVSKDGLVTNSVINEIIPGAGIVVTQQRAGAVSVSSDSELNTERDLNLCALDGVYIGTSNSNGIVYTFPANTPSSMTGVVRAPYLGETKVRCAVNILMEGSGASSGLSDLSVTIQSTASRTNTKAVPVSYPLEGTATTDTSKVYKTSVSIDAPVTSNDLLYIKLSASSPATATRVLAVSVIFSYILEEEELGVNEQ